MRSFLSCVSTGLARGIVCVILLAATTGMAGAASHGLAVFGDLKYDPGFTHFDYVNPDAPKGGTLRLRDLGSFDSVNFFILRGNKPLNFGGTYESLLTRAADEPASYYALLAESVTLSADRRRLAFILNPRARFQTGAPVRASDVAFSYRILTEKGHPAWRSALRGIKKVSIEGKNRISFTLAPDSARNLPVQIATMPVLPEDWFRTRDFSKTTLEPIPGSGPYRIAAVDPGRSITYRRDPEYWGRDLPVNKGRWNFDTIRIDTYRDRTVALEAFFAGAYDLREEFTSRFWATSYDGKPAVKDGRIRRIVLPDHSPSGVQAFFLNTRRPALADRRVRKAIGLAFDFEWINRNLFYGLYERTDSMFENSPLAHRGKPSKAELALLAPFRNSLPPELFEGPFIPPHTDGSGRNRKNLRAAERLLDQAGWKMRNGRRRNEAGDALSVEFLMFEPSFERIIAPYVKNLRRIGIGARMRIVDPAQYEQRRKRFDFDIITRRFILPEIPGSELRNYWGSAAADIPGSLNVAGVRNPAVDALIGAVERAENMQELTTAVSALDRVLMFGHYTVPQWFKGSHFIAFWDKFSRPAKKPDYARGIIDTWWVDPAKAERLRLRNNGKKARATQETE